ncbi:hypothetical protein A33Q_1069 [Indibacter alkaliphilus LW1]|uniref:Uncharacterized protein n=1 Tax=Indibacter alkaliphilus (strain CCUG 57479 / KCTC 22604 / LW1) TaxID=1189612 RepID=S2DMI8_INDAL|nr:hypothetical protein A33Q_1069 [Indibacter alkaliphilus LW1]
MVLKFLFLQINDEPKVGAWQTASLDKNQEIRKAAYFGSC